MNPYYLEVVSEVFKMESGWILTIVYARSADTFIFVYGPNEDVIDLQIQGEAEL